MLDKFFPEPCKANHFLAEHAKLLIKSYRHLTGQHLVTETSDPAYAAQQLYEAPFFVASHNTESDPILTYGNRTAQTLFEMTWNEFTQTPSRFTAEEPNREERARLLQRVTTDGFIDDYSGVRISSNGQRFQIEQATVWNLLDGAGKRIGQAATFGQWRLL